MIALTTKRRHTLPSNTYSFQYRGFPCRVDGLARTTATFVALATAYYRGTTDGFALAERQWR